MTHSFLLFYAASLLGALTYAWLIFRLVAVWRRMDAVSYLGTGNANTLITVIIPARNEAKRIGDCLRALDRQDYPRHLYEILVVDDHSTDATDEVVQLAALPNLRVLYLADYPDLDPVSGYKKQAITWAMEQARGELVVTTDADCIQPPGWLTLLSAVYRERRPYFIAAPVMFAPTATLLEDFQALDFLGMMLLTGAGIQTGWFHMCNGANLAYPRATFREVGGFDGIDRIASGDDMLFMHKIVGKYPGRLCFVKGTEALVRTPAQPTLRAFIRQRLRWATKSGGYSDWRVTAFLGLVFFLCWSILFTLPAFFLWGWPALLGGGLLLALKVTADYRLLSEAASFFERRELMRRFWFAQGLHILYVAGIGLLANVKRTYEWKGRKVR
jgi:cellulose synthase/poly-beta-1,6-N-acetylglucosamine synthase-like glycosyltransferase